MRLGKLALTTDLPNARVVDPMLWDDAAALFQAPAGSPMELRGALVLVALCAVELRGGLHGLAASVGYDPARLGGLLYAVVMAQGGDPRMAPRALADLLAEATGKAKAEEKPTPPPVEPEYGVNFGPRRKAETPAPG